MSITWTRFKCRKCGHAQTVMAGETATMCACNADIDYSEGTAPAPDPSAPVVGTRVRDCRAGDDNGSAGTLDHDEGGWCIAWDQFAQGSTRERTIPAVPLMLRSGALAVTCLPADNCDYPTKGMVMADAQGTRRTVTAILGNEVMFDGGAPPWRVVSFMRHVREGTCRIISRPDTAGKVAGRIAGTDVTVSFSGKTIPVSPAWQPSTRVGSERDRIPATAVHILAPANPHATMPAPVESESAKYGRLLSDARETLATVTQRANKLADDNGRLLDDNRTLLAENATLRRANERLTRRGGR